MNLPLKEVGIVGWVAGLEAPLVWGRAVLPCFEYFFTGKVGWGSHPRTIIEHPAINEILTKYLNYLLCKKSLKPATIKRKAKTIKSLLKHGVELPNPDNVIAFLNTCGWASGTKDITIDAYRDYLNMLGLTEVKLPHIRREETLPFVPLEEELDAVISSVRTKMATVLRVLKNTGARPIEAWTLKWTDISTTGKCVTITPAKYSHARKLKISEQTLNMIQALPRKNQCVFSPSANREIRRRIEAFRYKLCQNAETVSREIEESTDRSNFS